MIEKSVFLNHLKSKNPKSKNVYKRYGGAPIRYAGGKSLAVGHIIDLLPDDIDHLVSPFIGGGSVEVACSKELGLSVYGYDIFDILVNYWQVQINHPDLLHRELETYSPDKKSYYELKEILTKHWKKEERLCQTKLAALYYYNHNLSYGPGFLGWPSSVYMNETRYQKLLQNVRDFKPGDLNVECASFEKVFDKRPDSFFYCDPPYLLGEDTKMFRGIYPQRNFPIHHNGFNHKKLRDLLYQHKGGFILSYNDCPTIREWYSDFDMAWPVWQYTMGQGETRIGQFRPDGDHVKKSHEILIWNYPNKPA